MLLGVLIWFGGIAGWVVLFLKWIEPPKECAKCKYLQLQLDYMQARELTSFTSLARRFGANEGERK